MTYSEKLKDPRWQKKRLEIMQRDQFTCRTCSDSSTTLHVHHKYYISGREPWDYPGFAYITLCESCHDVAHNIGHHLRRWERLLDVLTHEGKFAFMPLEKDFLRTGLNGAFPTENELVHFLTHVIREACESPIQEGETANSNAS